MSTVSPISPISDPPSVPAGRAVVLHTRVVTESGGGPDKTILLGARYLQDSPYWVAAAYMHPPDDPGFATLRKRAADWGCTLIGVPDRGPLDRAVLRRLLELCRTLNVRIWHGHDYKSNLFGLMLRPFYAMKLVTTVHGWVKQTARTPLYYAVDRFCLPYYHHVISVSDDLQERVLKLGVSANRATLIPNGIDERMFSRAYPAAESPMRRGWAVPAGRLIIGAVGRLSPEKAFNNLIRAAATLIKDHFDIELWIAGQGDAEGDLRRLIYRLGVADRVKLLGFCEDTLALYHALDVFVLSSLREGLPNVVLEAMSMSVPVISTKVAGVPALLHDGDNGLLCEPGDVQSLTAALRRMLGDVDLRRRLADAGRRTIVDNCTFAKRMERERQVYDAVLAM